MSWWPSDPMRNTVIWNAQNNGIIRDISNLSNMPLTWTQYHKGKIKNSKGSILYGHCEIVAWMQCDIPPILSLTHQYHIDSVPMSVQYRRNSMPVLTCPSTTPSIHANNYSLLFMECHSDSRVWWAMSSLWHWCIIRVTLYVIAKELECHPWDTGMSSLWHHYINCDYCSIVIVCGQTKLSNISMIGILGIDNSA